MKGSFTLEIVKNCTWGVLHPYGYCDNVVMWPLLLSIYNPRCAYVRVTVLGLCLSVSLSVLLLDYFLEVRLFGKFIKILV